ncbi:homologous-pairing protein 2 [Tieghemostelium lacteum]|uniref:Homologous-pairing protein 2 n=1 Tax=Tieghemostelium lacteum TaxID=361077 RepID=A0A151ZGQ6_TIELA|nr:homologous-pairing protein 2 [Tieghemostelium lacteum]|eukprot:KYQ93168.1 homologous-pairing protein 2 [Tieghemostelium lacteum]
MESLCPNIGKTQLLKTLKSMGDKGMISMKDTGKSFLYWRKPDDEDDNNDSQNSEDDEEIDIESEDKEEKPKKLTIEELSQEVEQLKSKIDKEKETLKELTTKSRDISKQSTNDEIQKDIDVLMTSNKELSQKLISLKKNATKCTEADKNKLIQEHVKTRREWTKRKALFDNILSTILENSNKKKKDLKEICGWETDLEVGVKMIEDRDPKATKTPVFKRLRT